MKATCPKCGRKLRLRDWRPECPDCGVNIVQYRMDERLQDDADQAELEYAEFRPRLDRMIASTVGSAQAVIRLVCALLPPAALAAPIAVFSMTDGSRVPVNGIRWITILAEKLRSGSPLTVQHVPVPTVCAAAAAAGMLLLMLSVLSLPIHLVLLAWSGTPQGAVRVRRAGALALTTETVSLALQFVCSGMLVRMMPTVIADAKPGIGMYLYFALLCIVVAVDYTVNRRGLTVHYKPCTVAGLPSDEYRLLLDHGMTPAEIRASRAAQTDRPETDAV